MSIGEALRSSADHACKVCDGQVDHATSVLHAAFHLLMAAASQDDAARVHCAPYGAQCSQATLAAPKSIGYELTKGSGEGSQLRIKH